MDNLAEAIFDVMWPATEWDSEVACQAVCQAAAMRVQSLPRTTPDLPERGGWRSCVACDGKPAPENNPCAVSGTPAPAGELEEMQKAFRTTVSCGGEKPSYEMVFRFLSMDAMHRADDEWRAFRKTRS